MRLDDQEIVNTMWFTYFAGFDLALLQQLAEELAALWEAEIMPALSFNLTLVAVTATDQETSTSPSYVHVVSPAVGGGQAQESASNNVAACVTFLTAQRGRGGRGRNYLAGIPEDSLDQNTLSPTFMSAIISGYEAIGTALAALSFNHAIVSFQQEGAPAFTGGVPKLVTGYRFADNVVDSQRRRLPGRGQ